MSFKLFYDTVVIKNRFKYEKTKQKIFKMKVNKEIICAECCPIY